MVAVNFQPNLMTTLCCDVASSYYQILRFRDFATQPDANSTESRKTSPEA